MKKIHGLLIVTASLLLILIALWGWGHSYALQTTIPQHVQLSSWHIGTWPINKFRKELEAKIEQIEQTPLKFTFGNSNVKPIYTTLSAIGITYNVKPLLRALDEMQKGPLWKRVTRRCYFPTSWELQFQWEEELWSKHFTPDWEEHIFGNTVHAKREITSDEQVRYIPEKTVFRVDRVQLEQLIRIAIPYDWDNRQTVKIKVPLQKIAPPVTLASLRAEGIERKMIEFSTNFVPRNDGRTHNVNAVVQTIHNKVLKPGEIFDYDKIITKAEKKYGFKEAPIIFNGKLIPGIGGGVCQVSSTLYNAVLLTGLEVVERRNHSLPVMYLPKGLDATFSRDYINFRFKNTTGKHLVILSAIKNNLLSIQFFGTMDKKVSYKMEINTLKVLQPDIKYVRNPNLPIGRYEIIQRGKRGYKVEVYRKKLINGKVIGRERISVDTYRPQPTLIAVNAERIEQSSLRKKQGSIIKDGVAGSVFH